MLFRSAGRSRWSFALEKARRDGCDEKMSETLARIVDLVRIGEVRISAHGYDEIAEDGLLAGEVIDGIEAAIVIEDYPI